jgi:hypothetical protein
MPKREWQIDRMLADLINEPVRVAAKSFSPLSWNTETAPRFIPVRTLYLPDNGQPETVPVFFEGHLKRFDRQVGVVIVLLDERNSEKAVAKDTVYFRGKTAVILQGPALVELSFPFQVERLPRDPENYWRDIRFPSVQFELPFASTRAGRIEDDLAKKPND